MTEALDRVLQDALLGRAVLFLGAGAAHEASNAENDPLPVGNELAAEMCKELKLENHNYNLTTIAGHFKRKKGAHELINFLKRKLTAHTIPSSLTNLISLPWRRIYTTNYDNIIESTIKSSNVFSINDDTKNIVRGACIHLNGRLSDVSLTSLDHDLVLTDWSYAQSELYSSAWLNLFSSDVYSAPSILFAGYSMSDLDITRAIVRQSAVAAKCAIVVRDHEDEIVTDTLSSYGKVYPTGMSYLYARLKQQQKLSPILKPELILDSFQDLSAENGQDTSHTPRAERLYQQFIYGRIDEFKIVGNSDEDITIDRPSVVESLNQSTANGSNALVIHGGLGSGKTIAALLCARELLSKRITPYWATNRRNTEGDIDSIIDFHADSSVAFIFDNYGKFLSEIEYCTKVRRPGDFIILTERTQKHDLNDSYFQRVFSRNFSEINLDKLNYDEIAKLDELLNFCGLWRDFAGWRAPNRIRHAQETLFSSMSRILLDVVRSKELKERIDKEIDSVLSDKEAARLFVAALAINALQYDFWIRDWQAFFSVSSIQNVLSKHKNSISNFVNLTSSQWTTNSSLLSTELLRNVIGNNIIVDTLCDIFRRADMMKRHDQEMYYLKRDLMRYANIEQLINEEGKATALKRYYVMIRGIGDTANISDYWLQYGMALSIHGYLGESDTLNEAELAFGNAYKREETRANPNTRRIDNYYSRFQLQKAAIMTDSEEAAKVFIDASQKLLRQVFDEEARHYPFKVGRLFTDIAAAHFDQWSVDTKDKFIARCEQMVNHGEDRLRQYYHKQIDLMVNDVSTLIESLNNKRAKA